MKSKTNRRETLVFGLFMQGGRIKIKETAHKFLQKGVKHDENKHNRKRLCR